MSSNRVRVVKCLIAFLIGSSALVLNLGAQTEPSILVRIPFQFSVGGQTIAPGTYRFSLVSSQFLLSVVNVDTRAQQMFDVRPEQQRASEQHGRVVFRRTAGGKVLNEVHFPGVDMFSELTTPHRDQRSERAKSAPSQAPTMAQR